MLFGIEGRRVKLSLPCGAKLAARYLGSSSGTDISAGSCGAVLAVLDVSNCDDTLAVVRFDIHKPNLVIPTKYLEVLS